LEEADRFIAELAVDAGASARSMTDLAQELQRDLVLHRPLGDELSTPRAEGPLTEARLPERPKRSRGSSSRRANAERLKRSGVVIPDELFDRTPTVDDLARAPEAIERLALADKTLASLLAEQGLEFINE
jgi:hypothetical protein